MIFVAHIVQLAALKKIGGSSGKANGAKVIRSVVNKLISPDLMAKISWTGKSGIGKATKIKFQSYSMIIQLIIDVCVVADRNLCEDTVLNDLKYKVIKYAYTNSNTPSVSSASSTSSLSSRSSTSSPNAEISMDSRLMDEKHNAPIQSYSKYQQETQMNPQQHAQIPQYADTHQNTHSSQNFHNAHHVHPMQNYPQQQQINSQYDYYDTNYFNQNYVPNFTHL